MSAERKIIKSGPWHLRFFCKCGWSYTNTFEDPFFGPERCPECGNWHGSPGGWLGASRELKERGWKEIVVRENRTGVRGRWFWRQMRMEFETHSDWIKKNEIS